MESSWSNLVNNLTEAVHKIKYIDRYDDKKCEMCRIKYKDCKCCLQYKSAKDDLIEYKCLWCNKDYRKN